MWNETSGSGYFSASNVVDTPTQKKEDGARRLQNVTPVCVRQIRDSSGEEFLLFGVKSQILTLVCILRDVNVSSTKVVYTMEDHTGSIPAILWLENDGDNSINLPPVKEGRYLRLYGSMRVMDGVKTILVLKIMPIKNVNEISTHLLEVIHTRVATERTTKEMNSAPVIAQNNPSAELANSMSMMYTTTSNIHNFTPMQKKIYQALQADKTIDGVSRDSILSQFLQHQRRDADKAIEYLASEGHLYSTIDNDHFKATD